MGNFDDYNVNWNANGYRTYSRLYSNRYIVMHFQKKPCIMITELWEGLKAGPKPGTSYLKEANFFMSLTQSIPIFNKKYPFKASGKAFSIFEFKFPTAFEFGVS